MDDGAKILVIRGGAIGDFILTLPVLTALRAQFPRAQLEVLGYGHIAQLALAGGLADQVRSIEARQLAGFFARNGELTTELQEYFAGFAIVLSYLYDPDQIFQSNVARCSRAQFIAGPHRPDDRAGIHATEVFLKPLERLAVFDADPVPRLNLDPDRNWSRSSRPSPAPKIRSTLPGAREDAGVVPTLAFHPGSGSERKNWPEAKWDELLRTLAGSTAAKLLLVGGEAEGDRLERLASQWPADRVEVARSLALADLARRLTTCAAFVGHDSGITHLAAAVGLNGLVLWGESVRAVWSPRGPHMRILAEPAGLAHLTVERVARELRGVME